MITEEIPIMTHHLTSHHHLINNLLHHQPSQQQSPHKQLPPINTNHQSYNHQQQTATQQQSHLNQKPSQQQQFSHNNQSSYANNHPFRMLKEKSLAWNLPVDSLDFASHLDEEDHLRKFRELFSFPQKSGIPNGKENCWNDYNVNGKTQAPIHGLSILNGQLKGDNNKKFPSGQEKDEEEDCLYLCGQSLGLKPKSVDSYVQDVLDSWARTGVNCHFNGHLPAAFADIPPKEPMSRLVGAKSSEVAILNSLSVNLHVLLCTFYQPTEQRNKIIIEEHAFSSDMYVAKSQITLHGYSPDSSLVLLKPRPGESLIREEDAIRLIEDIGESVAVILLPGIQYYTGQLFNIPKLTSVAQAKGIIVGVDLAHAVGNVPLHLHEWEVDFAAWCTYKYLNSGAGCIGGIFVHERWTSRVTHEGSDMATTFPMLKGWWGNQPSTKFLMRDEFEPAAGADMFKLSNPPPVLCAMLMASLDIFSQTTMEDISRKQFLLTGYLEYLLRANFRQKSVSSSIGGKPIGQGPLVITFSPTNNSSNGDLDTSNNLKNITDLPEIDILTPSDPTQRGSQLSISFPVPLTAVQEELKMRGIVCDIRKPSVLRVAPAPLYNSFTDVYKFVQALKSVCRDLHLHK